MPIASTFSVDILRCTNTLSTTTCVITGVKIPKICTVKTAIRTCMNSFLNLRIVGINHLKLKIVSLSAMPFLLIITAVPSQISASSSRDFIAGWVLSANKIMNLSSVDFAIIKKSPLLSFAIMGALTFFSLFIFNRQSRARIFSFFADSIISISPVFCSGSSTDRFSACSFVIGIP